MANNRKVAVLVGSLRKDSLNRKLAKELITLAPDNLEFDIVEIGDLPLYNTDLDGDDLPKQWQRFRDAVRPAEAVLFVTPEYNRSVPGGLKNALDVGSRPMGESVWQGKPCAIITGSPGSIGGFGANHHLRQSLVFLNMPAMQQPEAYISGLGNLFDENGEVSKEDTREFLKKIIHAFASWVELIVGE